MESSYVISPEDVLESLMNDGTMDALRSKIINQLKANEELKATAIRMAEQSKVLNTPGAEKQTKRELFDALRQEVEVPVLEKASKSIWEVILDGNGLGKEINEVVEKVFCRLSGREPPLYPPPEDEHQQDKTVEDDKGKSKGKDKIVENDKGKSKGKEKDKGNDSGKEKLITPPKKRSYIEMSSDGFADTPKNEAQAAPPETSSNKSPA